MREQKIKLKSRLNRENFERRMQTVGEHRFNLLPYDSEFFKKLDDAYNMVGDDLELTVKQMNYLNQLAFELEKGA